MSKKKSRSADDSADSAPKRKPRKQSMLVSAIKLKIGVARHALAEIEGCLKEAEKSNLPSLEVDGATKIDRACVLITEFSDHIVTGLRAGKRESLSPAIDPETA